MTMPAFRRTVLAYMRVENVPVAIGVALPSTSPVQSVGSGPALGAYRGIRMLFVRRSQSLRGAAEPAGRAGPRCDRDRAEVVQLAAHASSCNRPRWCGCRSARCEQLGELAFIWRHIEKATQPLSVARSSRAFISPRAVRWSDVAVTKMLSELAIFRRCGQHAVTKEPNPISSSSASYTPRKAMMPRPRAARRSRLLGDRAMRRFEHSRRTRRSTAARWARRGSPGD